MSKMVEPETLAQAQHFDRVAARYRADGFCNVCAAQAAFGHAHGFTKVRPCCPRCRGLTPSYRRAGQRAQEWAGAAPTVRPPVRPVGQPRPRGRAT